MVRGSDGSYYATNLNAQVRLQFKDQQLIVIAPSGDRYVFGGGDARFETTRGTYAWYLTDVQSLTGRKTHLAWAKNGSGRRFLETVLYGGIGDDYQYQIDFSYEPTDYLFVSYLSGVESTLDRRVHAVTVRTKNGAGGSFDERWHYTLAYQQDKLGPGFFLTEVDQTYASGESAPPFRFGYRQAADGLATRSFQRATALEPMLSQFGQDVIQSNVSALVDIDQDGRPDLEERGGNSILQQTDKGYVVVPLGPMPKGASPLCRRAPSRFNLPRTLVEGMDGSDAVRVLGIQPNSVHTGTQIDLCERDGTVVGTQALAGYWQPSANVKLVDLNRDHQPDLIRVERAMYTVLPNISEKNGLAFDVPRGGLLSPPFTPSASYVQDMNGDGIPDLVARTNTIVTVWLGTGDYNFLTEGQSYELRSRSGLMVTGLDGFNFNFLDANRDGLSDLLLTRGTSFFLFVNDGLTFKEVAFPALNGLGTGASPPVVADLTGTGNTSVTITFRGQVVALELDDPGVGLLASVDDGRGNLLQLTYGRGPAAAGGRQRHSVLQSLTVNTTGQDAMRYSYSYLGPTVHSRGKFFLGYGEVTRSDPQQVTSMTLLNDDDVTGVALSSSTAETLTPSVSRYVVNAYEARTYLNVPWMRMTSARTGWANGNGSQTLEERTDYLTYDNEVCPTQVQTTKEAGKLTTITTRASVDKLADALHCLPDTVTTVIDARSDLQEQTHFARNGVGLPVSIERVGSDGGLTLQSIAYNDDFTIAAITKPGRGTVTFGYDPTTHLLLRMVSPDRSRT